MSVDKQQFQLPFSARNGHPRKSDSAVHKESERSLPERVAGIDQVLSTREIERITGRHRCTVYRWVCAGTFPQNVLAVDAVGFARISSGGSAAPGFLLDRPHTCSILLAWTGEHASAPIRTYVTVRPALRGRALWSRWCWTTWPPGRTLPRFTSSILP